MADNGKWITVNGNHILIKDGETVEQAMSRQFGTKSGVGNTGGEQAEPFDDDFDEEFGDEGLVSSLYDEIEEAETDEEKIKLEYRINTARANGEISEEDAHRLLDKLFEITPEQKQEIQDFADKLYDDDIKAELQKEIEEEKVLSGGLANKKGNNSYNTSDVSLIRDNQSQENISQFKNEMKKRGYDLPDSEIKSALSVDYNPEKESLNEFIDRTYNQAEKNNWWGKYKKGEDKDSGLESKEPTFNLPKSSYYLMADGSVKSGDSEFDSHADINRKEGKDLYSENKAIAINTGVYGSNVMKIDVPKGPDITDAEYSHLIEAITSAQKQGKTIDLGNGFIYYPHNKIEDIMEDIYKIRKRGRSN